jgi:hypothetical protein
MAHLEGEPHDQKNLKQDLVNVIQVTHEEKDESTEVFSFILKALEVNSSFEHHTLEQLFTDEGIYPLLECGIKLHKLL